jgi:hypothetical protein
MPRKTTTPLRQKAEAIAATRAKVGTDGKPATTSARAKKAVAAKKPVAKKPVTAAGPRPRLTTAWKDSGGKDVLMKATVTFDGKQWTVKSRFTSRTKEGVLVPSLALAPKTGKDKKGKHTPATAVTLA